MEEKKYIVEKIEDRNSVKFSINAKGKWSGEVKVYSKSASNAHTMALVIGEEIETLIKKKNGTD